MNLNLKGSWTQVTIDGRTFTGRSVSIVNGKVIVDGKEQDGQLVGPVSVTVNGDVEVLDNPTGTVSVTGSVGAVKTMSGDVTCGTIGGSVSTMSGDINRR